jgi:hypothetical protein
VREGGRWSRIPKFELFFLIPAFPNKTHTDTATERKRERERYTHTHTHVAICVCSLYLVFLITIIIQWVCVFLLHSESSPERVLKTSALWFSFCIQKSIF